MCYNPNAFPYIGLSGSVLLIHAVICGTCSWNTGELEQTEDEDVRKGRAGRQTLQLTWWTLTPYEWLI